MTEKVKVIQNQFDWLEKYKSDEEINYAIDIQLHKKRPDSPIADWGPSKVARALLIGYEIEPEYKVGDYVIYGDKIYRVYQLASDTKVNVINRNGSTITNLQIRDIRHATPEEIEEEQEREKWAGIEEGDVLISTTTGRVALFVRLFPHRSEVEVQIHRGEFEHWEKEKVALYAKKVGKADE